jgi:aspartate ammonia-lyase
MPDVIRAFAWVKKATALANAELGKLDSHKADAIVWACDAILDDGRCLDQFPVDVFQGGAGTSVNMNANEVIANLALEHLGYEKGRYDVLNPNDDVNMSQSTNDSYPTALHLAGYVAMKRLAEAHLDPLQASFAAKGTEFAQVLKMGRTQLQDAVPMTVGQEFNAFAASMTAEHQFLKLMASELLSVNLGATAIGTGINTPPRFAETVVARLAEVSGLPVTLAPDLIEATNDCNGYVAASSGLKHLAVKLSKICNDLRLLSSGPRAGFGEIRLPERAPGSSIMPAKVNPIIPEVASQVCFKVMGNDQVVTVAAEAAQLQLNAMEPVICQCVFESVALLGAAMDTLRVNCVDGIAVNADTCTAYVHNSIGIVTFLNPVLGHSKCDEIGKECARTGKSVRDVVLEWGWLTEDQLDQWLSFDAMTIG